MLEGAQADHPVEGAKGFRGHRPGVHQVDVKSVPDVGLLLTMRQRHADAANAKVPEVGQHRAPSAAEVEDPAAGRHLNLPGNVFVLAALRLLQREREVAVILGAAEIGKLADAHPEEAIGERVGEIDVGSSGHGGETSAKRPGSGSVVRLATPGLQRTRSARSCASSGRQRLLGRCPGAGAGRIDDAAPYASIRRMRCALQKTDGIRRHR